MQGTWVAYYCLKWDLQANGRGACVFFRLFFSCDFGCENRPAHVAKSRVVSTTYKRPGVRTNTNTHDIPVCKVYECVFLLETGFTSKRPWCLRVFYSFFFLRFWVWKSTCACRQEPCFFTNVENPGRSNKRKAKMIAPCARYMSSVLLLEMGFTSKRPWCLRVF